MRVGAKIEYEVDAGDEIVAVNDEFLRFADQSGWRIPAISHGICDACSEQLADELPEFPA